MDLYLLPLTYFEVYIVSMSDNSSMALNLAHHLFNNLEHNNPIFSPYYSTLQRSSDPVNDFGLHTSFIRKDSSYNLSLEGLSHEDASAALSPLTTLARGTGDCKSLSILATTYFRENYLPSRLVVVPGHMYVEYFDKEKNLWQRFESTTSEVKGFSVKGSYDLFYENLLKIIKEL
ncbi:transglutaminase domain-containing protein [Candidatus Woesearchaeota archaeon]|nr:MAG: transglutaminase domain-containing protein [Candidatus Woesearchaeota archaeon]